MASKVDARLLKSTKFPPEFNQKVDMQKVNLQVMKKWIANKISDSLGNEDDVVIELCFNLIEGPRFPDIKSLQIQLTGFLDKDTAQFCKDLWNLLLSAQSSPQGVPKELLEAKKLELMQEKRDADKAADDARRHRNDYDRRDREIADLKERDQRDRASNSNNRGDSWQGRRGNRGFDQRDRRGGYDRNNRPPRSPDQQHHASRDSYGRDRDRYVPGERPGRRQGQDRQHRRGRSPSYESPHSRSPGRSVPVSDDKSAPPHRLRKRSRSPRGDEQRSGHGGRNERDRGTSRTRQSRSLSSSRSSPPPKKRRESDSGQPSSPRRRRRSPSSSGSESRSRSRSRGRNTPEARPHRRRYSSSPDDVERRREGGGADRGKRRQTEGKADERRRNSSSASSISP